MINFRKLADWGAQGGLLSERECQLLFDTFRDRARVLEVGHYSGLSTCVLMHAMSPEGVLVTVDSHEQDKWVGASDLTVFQKNIGAMRSLFMPALFPLYMRSQSLRAPLEFSAVFYDGDHAEEQARFTEVVNASPDVKLFVFDDRDFEVPERCCRFLTDSGWTDCSPPCVRGGDDKASPDTMTLGVFRRG